MIHLDSECLVSGSGFDVIMTLAGSSRALSVHQGFFRRPDG